MSSQTKRVAAKEEAKQACIPKLRFPEFKNAADWTTRKLGSVATICTNKVGNSICVPMSITSGVGLVSQEEKFGRVIAGDSYKNYLLLSPNDFAYNKSSTKEYPEGFLTLYSGAAQAAVPNSIYTCFRVNGDSPDVRFLNYQFSDNLHGRWLRKFIQVGARAHGSLSINEDDLMALPVPMPGGTESVAEQKKIAECLSSVDELIAAQARKVDALKTHKKGLMQQLFPREGETQPRLRFPEFRNAGEWRERKFNQLVNFQSGGTPSKANSAFWGGAVPWVSAKDMKQLFLDDAEDHISTAAVDDGARLVPAGTLLMLVRGMTLLKNVPVCVVRRQMSFNQDVKALRPIDGTDGLFLALLLTGSKDRLLEMVTIAGHGTGKLDTDELKAMPFMLPSPAEQQRIASCLSRLDALIAVEAQKLEALKTHKKGLMQQLFPSAEDVDA